MNNHLTIAGAYLVNIFLFSLFFMLLRSLLQRRKSALIKGSKDL